MRVDAPVIPLCMLLAACGDAAVECVPLLEGVPMVSNEGPGVWETSPRLIEEWRAGGTNEGEELIFPISLVASPGGRIAIPDWDLHEVIVIEPDGTWLGPWTRGGSGPGEVTHPVAAAWRDDSTLVVFDILDHKLVTLRSREPVGDDVRIDPSFAGPSIARGLIAGITMQPSGAPVLSTSNPWTQSDGQQTIRGEVLRLDPVTSGVDTLARPWYPLVTTDRYADYLTVPGWPLPQAAVGGMHLAVAADDGSYRIVVYDGRGEPVRQVCRAAEGLPIDPRERGELASSDQADLVEAVQSAPAPPFPAAIGRIVVTTDGGLWVQRERPSVFGTGYRATGVPGALYDVFDSTGTYLGEVRAPAGARINAVSEDAVWSIETGSFDESWVLRYRIVH